MGEESKVRGPKKPTVSAADEGAEVEVRPTEPTDPCPLSAALLRLLQVSVEMNSTETAALAETLSISPHTVRTEFQRIRQKLGVHSRSEAVLTALHVGWITLEPTDPRRNAPAEEQTK